MKPTRNRKCEQGEREKQWKGWCLPMGLVALVALGAGPSDFAAADVVSLVLTTQADVDGFTATEITGNLTIQDDGSDPIGNLSGVAGLSCIDGALTISDNPALANLDGLSGLTELGGGLGISNNASLEDVDGLGNVAAAHVPRLVVRYNAALTNVDGLDWVTSSAFLYIWGNPKLENVDGLVGVTQVGKGLIIDDNDALEDLDGLLSLEFAGGLSITGNASLANLDGLSRLAAVYALDIDDNDALTNLRGLGNLTSITRDLYVTNNAALGCFCGLYPLMYATVTGAGGLVGDSYISGNLYNPTEKQILADGPCDVGNVIDELVADGSLNLGQAKVLSRLASASETALPKVLAAWVKRGLLTTTEAQLILLLA